MSEQREEDPRTSEELLVAHRIEREDESGRWEAMWTLRKRGGRTEFDLGRRMTQSEDPRDRAIGAALLGQLGAEGPAFVPETVEILLGLLRDPELEALESAVINLHYRPDPRAVVPLSTLAKHESAVIRYAVAFALGGYEEEQAITTLVRLARDPDFDTRNWAMFGLGTQSDADSDEIREALASGLGDPDEEIRGEALFGLARRHDSRVRNALLREWEHDEVSLLSLEAAEALEDPKLVPRLNELRSTLDCHDYLVARQLDAAIAALTGA